MASLDGDLFKLFFALSMLEFFSKNKVQESLEYQVNDFIFRWKKL